MSEALGGLTPDRPILLIADQAIDAGGGGAVILHSLLDDLLGRGICWASPNHRDDDPAAGHYALRKGSLGRHGRRSLWRDSLLHRGKLTREAAALAESLNARAVWVILHGASVHLAAGLCMNGALPVHVSVHDDPVHATALRSRQLFPLVPLIARDFRAALKKAASVDVVSRGMAERYERLYGVKSVLLHRALADEVSPAPPLDPDHDGLSIGVLGNVYNYVQLPILAEAAAAAGRELNVVPRIVVIGAGYGERLRRDFLGHVEVETPGHLSEGEAIERLRRCRLLYLNYPFGPWCRVLRETSFPTKLSTYLYAARPLLVHAPAGSSTDDLSEMPDYVCAWRSLNAAEGARLMVDFVRRPATAESRHAAAGQVRRTYYDYASHRGTLDRLLRDLTQALQADARTNP